jgi:predicted RNA binding protein YcfA (HicA-like mRNA interferase family)
LKELGWIKKQKSWNPPKIISSIPIAFNLSVIPKISRIHWKKFEIFLFKIGCEFKREKGDHRIYYKKGIIRPIVIPREKSIPEFVILGVKTRIHTQES